MAVNGLFSYLDGEVTLICRRCGKESYKFHPTPEQTKLIQGTPTKEWPNIQIAFPQLSSEVREMFISGLGPKCWKSLFGSMG